MKLSLITVVLNDSVNLQNTINSIRLNSQKLTSNFEYLIIDGLSSDRTVEIIKNNLDLVDFYISEKDDGVFDAMNKGVFYSSGDILWFINAGDLIYPSALEIVINSIQLDKFDILHGQTLFKNTNNKSLYLSFSDIDIKRLMLNNYIPHPSTLISKSLFYLLGSFNSMYKISADYDFFCRLASSKIFYSKKNLNFPIAIMQSGGISDYTKNLNFPFSYLKELFIIQKTHFGIFVALCNNFINFIHFSKFYLFNNLKHFLKKRFYI